MTQRPSKKKIQAVCRRISEVTDRRLCWRDTEEQVAHLNRMMVGWANYFCQGPVGKPYRIVTRHAVRRLCRWLCRKHKVETGQAITRYPDQYLNRELGLVPLYLRTATFRGRQHESLSESRMRAIRKSRSSTW